MDEDQTENRLAAVESLVEQLAGETRRLSAENADLRKRLQSRSTNDSPDPAARARPTMSRRGLLGAAAGAAAAGAVGLVAADPPAAAANGANLVLGSFDNTATADTAIVVTGTPGYAFGAIDTSFGGSFEFNSPAVFGYAAGTALNTGGWFETDAASGTGVLVQAKGTAGTGIEVVADGAEAWGISISAGSYGIIASSNSSTAALLIADQAQLRLSTATPNRAAPTGDSTTHSVGEVVADGSGALWYCVTAGAPGTWRQVSGANTAGSLHMLPAPVRVYDSRPGAPPKIAPQAPLAANAIRVLDLKANSSTVPAGATAALVVCLVVDAVAGSGNFTVWANGVARPASNTMVWGGTSGRASSLAVTALDANAKVQVSSSIQTDLAFDVVGYYR